MKDPKDDAKRSDGTNFSITNTTKGKLPRLSFSDLAVMKDAVLGKAYDLSFVIVGDAQSKKLNATYRGKNKPTNVLSFPLSKTEGEIFLNLSLAKKEAPKFDKSETDFVAFLFIHGLLHLKGLDHGSTMERLEKTLMKKFGF